jgi:hypothetical protein
MNSRRDAREVNLENLSLDFHLGKRIGDYVFLAMMELLVQDWPFCHIQL